MIFFKKDFYTRELRLLIICIGFVLIACDPCSPDGSIEKRTQVIALIENGDQLDDLYSIIPDLGNTRLIDSRADELSSQYVQGYVAYTVWDSGLNEIWLFDGVDSEYYGISIFPERNIVFPVAAVFSDFQRPIPFYSYSDTTLVSAIDNSGTLQIVGNDKVRDLPLLYSDYLEEVLYVSQDSFGGLFLKSVGSDFQVTNLVDIDDSEYKSFLISPMGKFVLLIDNTDCIVLDLELGVESYRFRHDIRSGISAAAINSEGNAVALSEDGSGSVTVFTDGESPESTFQTESGNILSLEFGDDGKVRTLVESSNIDTQGSRQTVFLQLSERDWKIEKIIVNEASKAISGLNG
ncbi:MAG: hypothetical protein Kapaf2KO_22870 [Candidatus Kapaibacteriales bacterium]